MNQQKIVASIKVIIKNKNKILLLKTSEGFLDIPGGRVEYGESNMKALARELNEEIGFKNFDPEKAKLFYSWSHVSKSKQAHYVYVVYVYPMTKMLKFKMKETSEIVWFSKADVKKMKHIPEFKDMLIRALR